MASRIALLLVLLAATCAQEDPGQADIMDSVPGYGADAPKVYTNFLTSHSSGAKLHYILVEGKANNNLPLTVWFNGGPGCSSKIGFLSEVGPYYLPAGSPYRDGTQLQGNPYSWHNLSNLLFIDGLPGVGYSSQSENQYTYNDANAAQDNLNALLDFFNNKFPSYRTKDVYLAGEDYAGKTVPDLALRISAYNINGDYKINIKGILVGNGIMDYSDGSLEQSQIEYIFSRNMIDPTLNRYWTESCQNDPASAGCAFFFKRYDTLLQKINLQSIYGSCFKQAALAFANKQDPKSEFYNLYRRCQFHEGIQDYFRIHASSFRADNEKFVPCNETIYYSFHRNEAGSMNEYARLVAETGLRIHLYSGDWDSVVPFTNTLKNLERLGLRQNGALRYWLNSQQQHVGFKRTFSQGQREVKFWVIKGAGHQAPLNKRQISYELFKSFLQGTN